MYRYEDLKKEPIAKGNSLFEKAVKTENVDFVEAAGGLKSANSIIREILLSFNAHIGTAHLQLNVMKHTTKDEKDIEMMKNYISDLLERRKVVIEITAKMNHDRCLI